MKQREDIKVKIAKLQQRYHAVNEKLLNLIYSYDYSPEDLESYSELEVLNQKGDVLQEQIKELKMGNRENEKDDVRQVMRLRRKNETSSKALEAQKLINSTLEDKLASLRGRIHEAEGEIQSMSSARSG